VTPHDLAEWRLRSLRLTGRAFAAATDVVGWLTAVQSQDYGPAKWALGQRSAGVTDADVERAFRAGSILRTHMLRPTWHFVRPDDIRWMLELTSPRVHVGNAFMYRREELEGELLARCTQLVVSALEGGNHLTRKELEARLQRAGIATSGFRTAYILMHAELNGVICSAPHMGKQHAYALLEERAPRARKLSRDEALAELTRRYFTSHGPATIKDFRWWSSLTVSDIKRGLALVGSQLEKITIDGVSYWHAEAPLAGEPRPRRLHLLQGYDEYIVGYSESKYVFDASGAARSPMTQRLSFTGAVVLDTQVVGHWRRAIGKDAVEIEVAPYGPLGTTQMQALEAEAERHGAFLGLPAKLVIGGAGTART
jgi:hypothetical protein